TTAVTPKLILGYFLDSLEDESIALNITGVEVENDVCVIDFDDSIYDIASMGKKVENAVLDAAAQSILDNIDEVDGVGFSINGKAYETANNKFSLKAVYMGK
ncbi:MAG: GerMN domain-containing protein, partial [Lachnospiraceae bacterium]|nr:GerMN domain-containing protein [Lachnospiraceae bacterium]